MRVTRIKCRVGGRRCESGIFFYSLFMLCLSLGVFFFLGVSAYLENWSVFFACRNVCGGDRAVYFVFILLFAPF